MKMAHNKYTTLKGLNGFSDTSISQLNLALEDTGLEYQHPELGGGDLEVVEQVVAWLDLHPTYTGVLVFTTAKIFRVIRNWYRKNPPKDLQSIKGDKEIKNKASFHIYGKSKNFGFDLDISRDYSYKELYEIIRKSKGDKK